MAKEEATALMRTVASELTPQPDLYYVMPAYPVRDGHTSNFCGQLL